MNIDTDEYGNRHKDVAIHTETCVWMYLFIYILPRSNDTPGAISTPKVGIRFPRRKADRKDRARKIQDELRTPCSVRKQESAHKLLRDTLKGHRCQLERAPMAKADKI